MLSVRWFGLLLYAGVFLAVSGCSSKSGESPPVGTDVQDAILDTDDEDSRGDLGATETGTKDRWDREVLLDVPNETGDVGTDRDELEDTQDVADLTPDVADLLEDIRQETGEIAQPDVPVDIEPEVVPPPCELDLPCDDGDACTLNDVCTVYGCQGEPKDCGDGLECTFDICSDGVCSNVMKPGWCYIWGLCWLDGAANPNNPCLECITAQRKFVWSNDDSNACNDGNPCTVNDGCEAGVCRGKQASCDDGKVCTLDFCDNGQCWHQPMNAVACDDGNLCTIGDMCISGQCVPGTQERPCDDFNPCTRDTCSPTGGCQYEYLESAPCEDGNLCTEGDYCHSGVCFPGTPVNCDDGNLCTTDSCSPFVGCKRINNNLFCDDGDPCSIGDQCLGGKCKKGPESLDCEDGNTCTQEWCSPGNGCMYMNLDEAACDDGDSCSFGDHCFMGQCVVLGRHPCNDHNPCTNDVCDEFAGCHHFYNSSPCNDGNACTVGDQCVQGECTSGLLTLDCFLGNPCVQGYCDPEVGCVGLATEDIPCDDDSVCTLHDWCVSGSCVGTGGELSCDDGNPCTLDWCDGVLGCQHQDIDAICNDLNVCTSGDVCKQGVCVGTPVSCNDGNPCTLDSCDKSQGCRYSVLVTAFCQPQLIIDYPPRAAELYGPPGSVLVLGHVVHNAAPVGWVKINGTEVVLNPDDTFEFLMPAYTGMNIIEGEVWDVFDGHDRVIQTFLMSSAYQPMNAVNPEASMMADAIMLYLGPNVFDDGNPNDHDDFASIIEFMLNSGMFDLNDFIPNPLTETGEYKVTAPYGIKYGMFTLRISCIHGGLRLTIRLPNISMEIRAKSKKWYLPDINGKVTASYLDLMVAVLLSVDGNGNVKATLGAATSQINNLNVDIDGVLGFLTNWLINFFEGYISDIIESELENVIKEEIPPVLEGALESLAFNFDFEIPALMEGLDPVQVSLVSKINRLDFSPVGGVVGLRTAIVTSKGVTLESLGSLRRMNCMQAGSPFSFAMLNDVEMALSDDLLNQIPYALWWSGLLSMPIDSSLLGGGDFEEFGILDMSLNLMGLRAPVFSDCGPDGALLMQMGDLRLDASMVMFGMPVQVEIYATFEAELSIGVEQQPDGSYEVALAVEEMRYVQVEIATVSENLVGSEDVLRLLIKQQILDQVMGQLLEAASASFPVPTIPLGDLVEQFPGDVELRLRPLASWREKGFTVLSGTFQQ
jgi:hypothetical protein